MPTTPSPFFLRTPSVLVLIFLSVQASAQELHHYVFFNRDHERIAESSFLETKAIEGAQLKYTWKELEPAKDRYDFAEIHKDLKSLTSHGKKLWLQVQDVSFDSTINPMPGYLMKEKQYHGGANLQYDNDEHGRVIVNGWVARRWDPAVRARFQKLMARLGTEFDGKIAGINLPETAVDFGNNVDSLPPGFSCEAYRDGILENMKALKKAFPTSNVLVYLNFMPGEVRVSGNRSYLRSVYETALDLHVGLGGPDLFPYKEGQMANGYRFIHMARNVLANGVAAQWGNYRWKNPKTSRRVTIPEMTEFATGYLGAHYIFWSTQEPFYSRDVLPFLGHN